MRLLFVIQRYGEDVPGGAERCVREYARRLAARGHDVHVLTSCARSYVDWANHYPEGVEMIEGVVVHRLPVSWPRPHHRFEEANNRVVGSLVAGHRVPRYFQESWMHLMGPTIPGLDRWIVDHQAEFDVAIVYTYLYFTAWRALAVLAGRVPIVFHPTAHAEPYLGLDLFDEPFRQCDALGFLTEEEGDLVATRFGPTAARKPSLVTGIGVELIGAMGGEVGSAAVAAFRHRFGVGNRPYLVYVGRVDPNKGTGELFQFFATYKNRRPGPLALVVIGETVAELPAHADVVITGFVEDETAAAGLAGAEVFVHPSYFESFSMVLTEAWAQRRPALVQGGCPVLVGQCARSGGGLPYNGYEEFEAALDALLGDEGLRAALGSRGRAYVEERYAWDPLLTRYEGFLETVADMAANRP